VSASTLSRICSTQSRVYVIAPLLYTSDFWGYLSFPVAIDSNLYKSDMQIFNVANIIKPDLSLDEMAFEQQRPLLLNPVFAITYGLSFAVLTSAISTVVLWHSKSIVDAFSSYKSPPDEHVQLLERNYPAVPKRWYYILGGSMLGLSVFLVMFYPLQLPVWALFLSIAIAVVFLIPCGIIAATTDTVIGLNVITEMVIGLLLPGVHFIPRC
jgi:ABC-type dipeptide/oligopeptide/nickel transport system permease subunit